MPTPTFKPALRVASAARRGLRLREKFGREARRSALTAHASSELRELSEGDVKAMHSFFAHHVVDKDTKAHNWNSDSVPSAGFVAGCFGVAMNPARTEQAARPTASTTERHHKERSS